MRFRVIGAIAGVLVACRPSDVLTVPPPIGVVGSTTLANQIGAENEFSGARDQFFRAVSGATALVELGGVLTDEFAWSNYSTGAGNANIDARYTAAAGLASGFGEAGDLPLTLLLNARSSLLLAMDGLRQYESPSGQYKVGEAYALIGYAEVFMAEEYCAGVPLSEVVPGAGYQYGKPLTTDSLLALAEAHFDSALAHAHSTDTVESMGSVGLGRARLDRGVFAAAAAAVASVPTGFVFNMLGATGTSGAEVNLYTNALPTFYGCSEFTMSDREGVNGLDFVSASDPRLVVDSTMAQTCDGAPMYYPTKFGNPSVDVPLATGVEARLIAAEAALHAGDVPTWTADLNALRAAAPNTYLGLASGVPPLTGDSTTIASAQMQVDVMFRERAFWLYGTGTRLGDLRRLIRQYRRDPSTVFPSGPFANGQNPNLRSPLPTYGSDVSFTLPTAASGNTTSNPYYRGCLSPRSTA